MTTVKIAKVSIQLQQDPEVDQVSGLTEDARGWLAQIHEGDTVSFRVSSTDPGGAPRLTGVRSLSPPTSNTPEIVAWDAEGDEFVSVFGHGDEFRIEVSTDTEPAPVPVGGGHFRVLEEAGG